MIREKTIFCKLNQIKFSDRQLLRLASATAHAAACPSCGALGCSSPHGCYQRDLIFLQAGLRQETCISIKRIKCNSCNKTHAILPDLLIPHSSYSIRFVLSVLRAYLTRPGTVAALCERFSIAVSTFYAWKRRFREHANLWLSALESITRLSLPALALLEDIPALPSAFFARFRFSFLQGHQTTHCSSLP